MPLPSELHSDVPPAPIVHEIKPFTLPLPIPIPIPVSISSGTVESSSSIASDLSSGVDESGLTATPSKVQDQVSKPSMGVPLVDAIEQSKRLAAYQAVDNHVLPEHKVIGIGSGSTVPYVVERIIAQGKELNKGRVFIPSGFQSKQLIVDGGLRLGDVDQYPTIDVTVDGADEVDHALNCVKGGGAAHLREKVLAEAAKTFVLVADYRKNVQYLGTNFAQGVPIEVVPFAYAKVLQNLHHILGSPKATLRMAIKKAGPVVTDNGNFVIDAPFGREHMIDPYIIMAQIKMLTGVVEVGLFCKMAKAAYFGNADGSVTVRWNDGKVESINAEQVSGNSS